VMGKPVATYPTAPFALKPTPAELCNPLAP
jgi:hypothetical protein